MTLKQKIFHEVRGYWINVLYLIILFSVFTTYKRLLLAQYDISYGEYGISTIAALILAKVILVLEALHLGRGFENKPLIIPTFYKSFLFTVCVVIFKIIESTVRGLLLKKGLIGISDELMKLFSYEWLAMITVVFFVFIPFFAIRELDRVLGKGRIFELFFRKRTEKN
ncbi:MAG: hypothetical protein NTV07_00495 [Candidatus Omnitrophica bacterium]|nr:hypothetical protein [Candidatus Omnitrophota bacterium]